MALHSHFLVHWTGREFHKLGEPCSLKTAKGDSIREKYLERLEDTLKEGLFMKNGAETIRCIGESPMTTPRVPRVCLTEIRLSQSREHAKRYGLLGIGFHRNFVLKVGGNPAFYVQPVAVAGLFRHLLREEIGSGHVAHLLGFLKTMYDTQEGQDKLTDLYEEMEWRILCPPASDVDRQFFRPDGRTSDAHRLILEPKNISLLVFPDRRTLNMARTRQVFERYFSQHTPTLTTLTDCGHF